MGKVTQTELIAKAQAVQPEMIRIRRDIHAHPELSGQEKRTSEAVISELQRIGGYQIQSGIGGHGVLADLIVPGAKETIALRADMDALSVEEETGLPYASQNAGVMHACGHDTHVAMLLGAAEILMSFREDLPVNVRLIFQPAEELSPVGGSRPMMREGALEDVTAVYGLHVWPALPFGVVGVRPGAQMASSDFFTVDIKGKSSHGAQPDQGLDALIAGTHFVHAAQTIVSRSCNPLRSAVLTIGYFKAGSRYNIVPEECRMEGTVRTFDPETQEMIENRLQEVLDGTCAIYGCTGKLHYQRGYTSLRNDPAEAERVRQAAESLFGPENAIVPDEPSACAEDFAYYLENAPGAFAWLGTTRPGAQEWPLHSCHYAPDEDVFWRGAALFAQLVLSR
ncbi:MAG: amidohydrolase [Mogibacterium sp.]|nr:amidohydrolase [Mogibacterium sp.]